MVKMWSIPGSRPHSLIKIKFFSLAYKSNDYISDEMYDEDTKFLSNFKHTFAINGWKFAGTKLKTMSDY